MRLIFHSTCRYSNSGPPDVRSSGPSDLWGWKRPASPPFQDRGCSHSFFKEKEDDSIHNKPSKRRSQQRKAHKRGEATTRLRTKTLFSHHPATRRRGATRPQGGWDRTQSAMPCRHFLTPRELRKIARACRLAHWAIRRSVGVSTTWRILS